MCLNCGGIKCGALVPCDACASPATGNLTLDIAFTDHRIPREKLLELGAVVSEIHRVCEDRSLCLWTFLQYVSLHHPSILEVHLKEDAKQAAAGVLAQLQLGQSQTHRSPRQRRLHRSVRSDSGRRRV